MSRPRSPALDAAMPPPFFTSPCGARARDISARKWHTSRLRLPRLRTRVDAREDMRDAAGYSTTRACRRPLRRARCYCAMAPPPCRHSPPFRRLPPPLIDMPWLRRVIFAALFTLRRVCYAVFSPRVLIYSSSAIRRGAAARYARVDAAAATPLLLCHHVTLRYILHAAIAMPRYYWRMTY